MTITEEIKCPKCKSVDIRDTGCRVGDTARILPGAEIPEPKNILYECKNCEEQFFSGEKE